MSQHYLKVYWLFLALGRRKVGFVRIGTYAPVGSSSSIQILAELSGLCGLKDKKERQIRENA